MSVPKFLQNVAGQITEVFAAITTSLGAGSSGQLPALDATGRLDVSFMPVGIGANTASITASEAISAGSFVNVWNNSGVFNVRNADCSAAVGGKKAHGFVLAAVANGAVASVYFTGNDNTGVTGAVAGDVFLSTSGSFSSTAPTTSGYTVQRLGTATSATSINFVEQPTIVLA
jgi:hypothetical protein